MQSTSLSAFALALVLTGCTLQPKPMPPTILQNTVVFIPASLRAGCLLPEPQLLGTVAAPSSTKLAVRINEIGLPIEAKVVKSTGSLTIDNAFRAAVVKCEFSPATAGGAPAADWYELQYSWTPRQSFLGPSRCFTEPYPRRALRTGESAVVKVYFRVAAAGGAIQTQVNSTPPSKLLSTTSINAVEKCLAHPEALVGIEVGRWHAIEYIWRLED